MNRTPTPAHAFRMLAVATAVTLAGAAGADTGSDRSAKPQARAKSPWVQAAAKHGGSGIRLRYSVPAQLQAGQPAAVQLELSGVTSDEASVEVRAPAGATLTSFSGEPLGRVSLPPGQTTTLDLRLTPAGDGMQTLDVFTTQAARGTAQSVPLKVGSGAVQLKAGGKVETTPSGEKVISLPAQTSR